MYDALWYGFNRLALTVGRRNGLVSYGAKHLKTALELKLNEGQPHRIAVTYFTL